jgi:hypothetical protein
VVTPPAPAFRAEALAGALLDLRGRFAAPIGLVALERPTELDAALGVGLDPALRVEAGALAGPGGARTTLLAGPSLRLADGAVRLAASATAGALLGAGSAALAGRAGLSLGLSRRGVEPFVELSVLGARGGAPGPFVATGVAVGVRLGLGGNP